MLKLPRVDPSCNRNGGSKLEESSKIHVNIVVALKPAFYSCLDIL